MSRKKYVRGERIFDGCVFALCLIMLFLVVYPLVWVISASFSTPDSIMSGRLKLFPVEFTLEGYQRIIDYKPIWIGYRNTLIYTVAGTFVNLLVTLPAAYALSRRDLPGRAFFTLIFSFTMFFSGGLIPTYLVVQRMGLLNSPAILIILGALSVWNMIIARTYFQNSVPHEIEEAAYIDGCSITKLFLRIILPLSMPMISVLMLYYAVGHWNSYFNAMIYISDTRYFPLQLFLRNVLLLEQMDEMITDPEERKHMLEMIKMKEVMKYGLVVVSSLPVMILYPFLQKFFIKGMMVGSVKG